MWGAVEAPRDKIVSLLVSKRSIVPCIIFHWNHFTFITYKAGDKLERILTFPVFCLDGNENSLNPVLLWLIFGPREGGSESRSVEVVCFVFLRIFFFFSTFWLLWFKVFQRSVEQKPVQGCLGNGVIAMLYWGRLLYSHKAAHVRWRYNKGILYSIDEIYQLRLYCKIMFIVFVTLGFNVESVLCGAVNLDMNLW